MVRWLPIVLGLCVWSGAGMGQAQAQTEPVQPETPEPPASLQQLSDDPSQAEPEAPEPAEPEYQALSVLLHAAEQHSPSIRAARHNIAAAEALLSEAKGSPFFQFTAQAGIAMVPDVRGTPLYSPENNQLGLGNSGWNVAAGADLTGGIPLYTAGKLKAARGAAQAGIDAAEGDRDRIKAKLQYDVRRAYFGLQFALDVLQLIHEGQGKLEGALRQLRERLEDGEEDARQEDVWRLSAALAEIQARKAEAEQLEGSARAALATLTGLEDVTVIDCPSVRLDYTLKPLDFYTDAARLNRPEGRMLDGAVRARTDAVKAARGRLFPDLALVLGVGRYWAPGRTDQLNPFATDSANRSRFEAGLAARWSLDVWGNHYRTERAKAELSATRAMKDEAEGGIALEVTAAYELVAAMQQTEQAWERAHGDTRAWFLAATQAYQIGTNEPKDVVDAVKAYFQARASHLDAIRKHNTGVAELQRVAGTSLIADDQWETKCY